MDYIYKTKRDIRRERINCSHNIDVRISKSGHRTEYYCILCDLLFSASGASYYLELCGERDKWKRLANLKNEMEEYRKNNKIIK